MGIPYVARGCRVAIRHNAVVSTLMASRVTVQTNADRIDVTNFESGNDPVTGLFFGDYLSGVTSATVTIELYDDSNGVDELWATGLRAGINEGEVYIYLTSGHLAVNAWYFGKITVIDVGSDLETHGAVKSRLVFFNRGRFYYPGSAKPVAAFGN
jgi:hypothetical protein